MPVNWGGQTIYISFVWGLIITGIVIFICFIPLIISLKRLAKKAWACPNCGYQFKTKWYRLTPRMNMSSSCMMRCLKCRKIDWHSYRD